MSSIRASHIGGDVLAPAHGLDASAASAADAPRASPARAAPQRTSSISSSVSENWTTFGRDRRRFTTSVTITTRVLELRVVRTCTDPR